MNPLKIIFAGTPEFAAVALRALLAAQQQIVAVYTQPDRPAGRGRKLTASPVKQLALDHGIPLYQPVSLKDAGAQDTLRALQADLMVVAAYGLILPAAVLTIPRLGCINIHASLLPRWRGAAPIQRAIIAGDSETGISIMQMDAGLDTGAVMLRRTCLITPDDTAALLHDRLAQLGAECVLAALALIQLAAGENRPVVLAVQDNAQANYATKISKTEAELDWSQDAANLQRVVRAFNPWPIAQTRLAGGQALRIWSADVAHLPHDYPPGSLIQTNRDAVLVAAGKDALRLTRLQLPGGRPLPVADFLHAHPLAPEDFCVAGMP